MQGQARDSRVKGKWQASQDIPESVEFAVGVESAVSDVILIRHQLQGRVGRMPCTV